MKTVELYARVRHAVMIEGISERAAADRFGINARTVSKMLKFSVPPGYVRRKPPFRPKLDGFTGIIEAILSADRDRPKKQRHTSRRVFERLRDEHGFTGKITIVKDYVAGWRQRTQEMFVPLIHPPGHAQADFGEAIGVIGGVERKIHFFAMDLPHSDAIFVVGYPAETTEAFCDGHVKAFTFFDGVPQSILYDNTKIAVARILGDGKRQRTRVFSELQSHYLFTDRFGRPGKGNDKGKVEGLVGYARRNFLVPIPVFESFEALNAHLLESCRKRLDDRLRGHDGTIGERLERDLAAFQTPLPAPYDACEKVTTRVSSLALARYRLNDYSVPTAYGHQKVLVRGYVHEVVITCGAEIIARHPRSYEREDLVFNPLHYLALLEQKTNALDQAAPLAGWKLPEEFATEPSLSHEGEGREVVAMLAELPDLWDVNISGWSRDSSTSRFEVEGFQEPFVSFVKSITTKPVVGVGRYTSPDRMVSLVKGGVLDLIGAARPSIADPFLPRKILEGRVEDIRECIGCNVCVACDAYGVPIRCTQNPTISEEWRRGWHPERLPAPARKASVLVIGAGPAGLDCALTLGRSGIDVTLAEASDVLGGRVTREARLAGLLAWARVRDYRTYQLGKLANVSIYRESPMTADEALGFGADHIVVATGASWRRDGVGSTRFAPMTGLDQLNVLTPDDIFAGAALPKRAIVYDDEHNYLGGVLSEHLARAGGKVTHVTPHPLVSAWTDMTLEQARIVSRLHSLGVTMKTTTTIDRIEAGRLHLKLTTTGGALGAIEAGALLLVTARLPEDALYHALQERGLGPGRLSLAGDAVAPGLIQAAVLSGHTVARRIIDGSGVEPTFRRDRGALADG